MEPYLAIADQGSAAGMSLIALLLLIALLVQREFAVCIAGEHVRHLTLALAVALPPLLIIGVNVIVLGIAEVLQ